MPGDDLMLRRHEVDEPGSPERPVLVVDDHCLVRAALVGTLRAHGFTAHACAQTSLHGIVEEAAGHPPGVVLLDLDLGVDAHGLPIHGVDVVAILRAAGWSVVVVTGSSGRQIPRIAAAIAAGAVGQVPKTASFTTLVEVVGLAVTHRAVMTEQERGDWLELDRRERVDAGRRAALLMRLTMRERVVLERLTEGHRATEIAEEAVVSVTTVRSQIRAILTKLEVNSQLGAVALLRAHIEG